MRLHRQASPGDWDGVVARLAAELGDAECPAGYRSSSESSAIFTR
jgi:hypothetical protein